MFRELPLSVFWIFLKSFLVTSAKSLPLPVAILLRNSLGFTQETVWHAPVLAAKASILVLRFIYLPKLVAGKQQTFPWIRKRVLKYQLVIPDMKYLQINVWIFVSNVEVVGRNKDGLICPVLECLPFTISYHLHFLRISKSRSMLHHGSVWRAQSYIKGQCCEFRVQGATLCLHLLSLHSCCCCCCYCRCCYCCCCSFDEVSNFRNIILTYQKPRFVIRNCQWNCVATLVDFGSMGCVIMQIRDRAFKTHTQAFGILLSLQKLGWVFEKLGWVFKG